MRDLYLDQLQRLEADYYSWIQKADEILAEKDYEHSKQECVYLQKAMEARAKMASLSPPAEKAFHESYVSELNQRLIKAIRAIDPGYFDRAAKKAAGDKAPTGNSGDVKAAADVPPEEVQKWHKPIPAHAFKDVDGMTDVIEKLKACFDDCEHAQLREYLGLTQQKSYLFVGPPGCGKTYITEAFIHELHDRGFEYISLNSAEILSKYVGDAEKIVAQMFKEAVRCKKCVLFIDELDGVCKNRDKSNLPEYASSITTAFLTGYNEMKSSGLPIIFIGATNFPNNVDRAMLDRTEVVEFPFPDAEARIGRFRSEFGHKKGQKITLHLTNGFTFQQIAELTKQPIYNYRDIDRLCDEIRMVVMKHALDRYGTDARSIEALKKGEFGVDRVLFLEAQSSCKPCSKDKVVKYLADAKQSFEDWIAGDY